MEPKERRRISTKCRVLIRCFCICRLSLVCLCVFLPMFICVFLYLLHVQQCSMYIGCVRACVGEEGGSVAVALTGRLQICSAFGILSAVTASERLEEPSPHPHPPITHTDTETHTPLLYCYYYISFFLLLPLTSLLTHIHSIPPPHHR